ncbi:MAG: HEPN domain-containing protein, partial [Nitrososphaeria archaeon]|nr:HEPN domain-containing protein [Nitrososphaeria archaeon]
MPTGEVREEAMDWWREALHNLRQARRNYEIEEYSVSAFLAHQAAEKALKGFLYLREEELARGHSVAELCERAARHDPTFADLRPRVAGLDLY